jgi:hypothetical protein
MATTRRGTTKKTAAAKRTPVKKTAAAKKTVAPQKRPARDIDYTKSTGAYPMGPGDQPPAMSGPVDDDVDYSKSTMAYPMSEAPAMQIVTAHLDDDGQPIDFSKSVDRYPMFGEYEQEHERVDPEQPAEVRHPTPGPQSSGVPDGAKGWKAQRDRLALDPSDPSGESDTDWTPEDAQMTTHPDEEPGVPHTTPAGEPQTHEQKHPGTDAPATEAKVVKAPAKTTPEKNTEADTK